MTEMTEPDRQGTHTITYAMLSMQDPIAKYGNGTNLVKDTPLLSVWTSQLGLPD